MNDLLSVAIELVYVAVLIGTLRAYMHNRNSLSRDVMLVFASLVGLLVISQLGRLSGAPSVVTGLASTTLLVAQPLLIMSVCVRIGELSRVAWWAALMSYVVTILPLFVLAPLQAELQPWMVLPALAAFVTTEGAAAWCLARAGLRRVGAARVRLLTAAAATSLFALALLGMGLGAANAALIDVSGVVVRLLGLVAALGYAFAFLPFAPLQRVWHAAAGFNFTEDLIADGGTSADEPWHRLIETARRVTGASHAFVVLGDAGERRALTASGAPPDTTDSLTADGSWNELVAAADGGPEHSSEEWTEIAAALRVRRDHAVLSAVAFEAARDGIAVLAWVTPRRSLFARDDQELLEILGNRAAVWSERAAMLDAQASMNDRLAATNEALEDASRAKSDFLASMSHELRTPLSAIIGFSSLMRDEPGDAERVSIPREWVEHVSSSGEHLLALINDVLDLSKVEAGRLGLERECFDLVSAVAALIGGMRPLADAKQITLTYEPMDIEVDADRGRLRQILYNLVSNAVKFTPAGGRVTVSATRAGDGVQITVADTGVGIAPDDLERVFAEFQQVGDADSRQGGTGLGLALTRRLVEAHGGRVELESVLGEGSRFTVVLPDADIEARAEQRPPRPATVVTPVTAIEPGGVLVMEDDPSAVRLLRAYLEGAGHRMRVSGDGESGLAEARRSIPSAIILDLLLPGKDGWDVLRELKSDPVLREVPVVVVTVVDERELGMALGAVDYFIKPVDRDALLARLARHTLDGTEPGRPVKVLIVDDEHSARSMVEAALVPAGFDVLQAASGREGIARAREDGVDFVICDLLMPDLDGFEVVARLHADDATKELPILILTAHDLTVADNERLKGHVLGVVSKGDAQSDDLRSWLTRALGSASSAA